MKDFKRKAFTERRVNTVVAGFIILFNLLCFQSIAQDNALNFDGTNDHVTVPHNAALNFVTGDFTLEAWVYWTGTATNTIISKGNGNGIGNSDVFIFARRGTNSRIALELADGVSTIEWGEALSDIPLNTWTHVAVSFDNTTNTATFYQNGQFDGTHTYGFEPTDNGDAQSMYIGRQGNACNCNFWSGELDEVRVWNIARTQEEIIADAYLSLTSGTGLLASYDFNQGVAASDNSLITALPDISANSNDGTLNGPFALIGTTSNWVSSTAFATDVFPPIIVSSTTLDTDQNGQIDQISVLFSEDLDGATVTDVSAEFTLGSGYVIFDVVMNGTDGVDIILVESGSPDTDVTPAVNLIAATLFDLNGNSNIAQTESPFDGAQPTYISGFPVVSNLNTTAFDVDLQLSETGTAYLSVLSDGSAVPSALEVQTGTASGTITSGVVSVLTASTTYIISISGLTPGVNYDVYLVADDAVTNLQAVAFFLDVTMASPPAAPTNLIAYASSGTEVTLEWTDNSGNEDFFSVERATDFAFTSPEVVFAGVTANSTSYVATAGPDQPYFYRVIATNGFEDASSFSSVEFATTETFPGQAMDFSGSTSANVRVASYTAPSTNWTYEFWMQPAVNLNSSSLRGDFFDHQGGTGLPTLVFNRESDGTIRVYENGFTQGDNPTSGSTVWTGGEWYHIAATYDGSNVSLYINGILEDQIVRLGVSTTASDLFIGAGGGAINSFDGKIDEFKIWDIAKTDFSDRFASVDLSIAQPNLISYFPFDEASGGVSVDRSTNTNDGIINGSSFVPSTASITFMNVISTTPNLFENSIASNSNISINFDASIDGTTLTDANIKVRGSQSGVVPASYLGGGTSTLTIDPAQDFLPGEQVSVTVTNAVAGLGGEVASPFTLSFNVASGPFEGAYVADNNVLEGQSYGRINEVGDYDGDGDLDIMIGGFNADFSTTVTSIYQNNAGTFTDISAAVMGTTNGRVKWGDYDGDGDLDIAVIGDDLTNTENARIYRNDAGTYVDIEVESPGSAALQPVRYGSLAWGDYDNDGDLDLFLSGLEAGETRFADIYENNAGVFTPINSGIVPMSRSAVDWGDYDYDGDLDIVVMGRSSGFPGPNTFEGSIYRNDDGIFTDIGAGLPAGQDGMLKWGDYDNDNDLDLLYVGSDSGSLIFRNDAGVFTDINAGLTQMYEGTADWGDYDGDGDLDILVMGNASGTYETFIYRNDGGNTFTEVNEWIIDFAYGGASWGDFDNDGDLDIVINGESNNSEYFTLIYENTLPPPTILNATKVSASGFTANLITPSGAIDLVLDVSADPAFGSFLVQDQSVGISGVANISVSLTTGTQYYFRAKSDFGGGSESPYFVSKGFMVQPGNALPFTSNQYVNVFNNDEALQPAGDFTIEFWLNTTVTGNRVILEKGNTNTEYSVQQFSGDVIGLNVNGGMMQTVGSYNDGQWHHFAMIYRGPNDGTIYVDGVEDVNTGAITLNIPSYSFARLSIGDRRFGGSFNIEGSIDEVRIWDDERSLPEINEYLFTTLAGNEQGLVAYYQMDQLSGTTLPDRAGINDGSLSNMTGTEWTASGAFVAPIPGAPTALVTAEISATEIQLSWTDNATFETDYAIFRSDGNNLSYSEIATVGANVTTYSDNTVSADNNYFYYVVSRNLSGDSAPTNEKAASTFTSPGNALSFDGLDDHVAISDNPGFQFGAGDFTIETWFYYDGTDQGVALVGKRNPVTPFEQIQLRIGAGFNNGAGKKLEAYVLPDSRIVNGVLESPEDRIITSEADMIIGWHHAALVEDYDVDLKLYLDGVLIGADSDDHLGKTLNFTSQDIILGATEPSGVHFAGLLDEVRIWNTARTNSEIQATLTSELTGAEPGLLAYYKFDQSAPIQGLLPDRSINLNNGTLNNFAGTASWPASGAFVITPISLQNIYPANNAMEISLDTTFSITFSDTVKVGTGNIYLIDQSDSSIVETLDVSTIGGLPTDSISFSWANIDYSISYSITIDSAAFLQNVNTPTRAFTGISDTVTWSFRTADQVIPEVNITTIPVSGTNILQGSVDNLLYKFSVSSSVGESIIQGMLFGVGGTNNLSDFPASAWKLYESPGTDVADPTTGNLLLSTDIGTLVPDSLGFALASNVPVGTINYYYLLVDIDPNAAIGNTVSIGLPSDPLEVTGIQDPKVKLDGGLLNGESFTIDGPVVTVTAPNGGEVLTGGDTLEILWSETNSNATDSLVILWSLDSGSNYTTVGSGQVSDFNGAFSWVVPDTLAALNYIKVSNITQAVSDSSDAEFEIRPALNPGIQIISPNGGELITTGVSFTISWVQTDIELSDSIRVELSLNNGGAYQTLAEDISSSFGGGYEWTPSDVSENALVRISTVNGSAFDNSNGSFRIVQADSVAPIVSVDFLETLDNTPMISGLVNDSSATIIVTVDGVDYPAVLNTDSTWVIPDNTIGFLITGTYDVVATATDPALNVGTDQTNNELRILPATVAALPAVAIQPLQFTAVWDTASGVTNYLLEVSDDAAFGNLLTSYDPFVTAGTSAIVAALDYNSTYYYRVSVAYTSGDTSAVSNVITVRTISDPATELDSLALIAIYDNAGGEQWINNTGWKTDQVRNWYGITFEGARVTEIDLSSNNLLDTIPAISQGLGRLTTIDLSENELNFVGSLTALDSLSNVNAFRNRLDFISLQNIISTGAETGDLSQKLLLNPVRNIEEIGNTVTVNRTISGSDSYTWFEDDIEITNAGGTLNKEITRFADEATYRVESSSANVPGVTLISTNYELRVSSLERDSLSLRIVYDSIAQGSAVSDWTALPIADWQEVTITGSRVTAVDLLNLGLSGKIPASIVDIRSLQSLDLSNNDLTGLPNLTGHLPNTSINLDGNRLDFADLENTIGFQGTISYQDQQNFGDSIYALIDAGTDYLIDNLSVEGSNNSYTWRYNGTSQPGRDSTNFLISSISRDNMGRYTLNVDDDRFDVTLTSQPQIILAQADIRLVPQYENDNGPLSVLEAGDAGAQLFIKPPQRSRFQQVDTAVIVNGELLFENKILDDYYVYIRTDRDQEVGPSSVQLLSTYYDQQFDWEQANLIELDGDFRDSTIVERVPADLPPLPTGGRLAMLVETDFAEEDEGRLEARRRVRKAGCSLRRRSRGGRGDQDEDGYVLIAYQETDDNGEVSFGDLPAGDYRINIQFPGIPMDPDSDIDFTINEGEEGAAFSANVTITEEGIDVQLEKVLGIIRKYFKDLVVYPNPANEFFTIKYDQLLSDNVRLELVNISGSVVMQSAIQKGYDQEIEIETNELPQGIYFMYFYDTSNNNENILTYKVIIRH